MPKKYAHITDSDRLQTGHMLGQRESLKKIATKIGKHHSTVFDILTAPPGAISLTKANLLCPLTQKRLR